jgi:hypothetical protein
MASPVTGDLLLQQFNDRAGRQRRSCAGLGRERSHGWNAFTALPPVVARQHQVEHYQVGERLAAREQQGGAGAVATGDAVASDIWAQTGLVRGHELHVGHAGLPC